LQPLADPLNLQLVNDFPVAEPDQNDSVLFAYVEFVQGVGHLHQSPDRPE
jgi:hypothetical protein